VLRPGQQVDSFPTDVPRAGRKRNDLALAIQTPTSKGMKLAEAPIIVSYRVELLVGQRVVDQVAFSALDVTQVIPRDAPGPKASLWNQSICDTAQERLAIDHEIVEHSTDTWLLRVYAKRNDDSEARAFRAMLMDNGRWEIWNLHA